MTEHIDDALSRLRALSNGTYEAQRPPPIDLQNASLFAGLSRVSLDNAEVELLPGLHLKQGYAHVFQSPMVAVAPPPTPRAASPAPWYALENGHVAETAHVEVSLMAGARPLDMPRIAVLRLVAATIRLLSSQPICLPILSNVPLNEARQPSRPVHIWQVERPLNIYGQPVKMDNSFIASLPGLIIDISALHSDLELARAFILADGFWWQPTAGSQLVTIWTVIEMLMRPGRRDTTKCLARAVRKYVSQDRASGDRLYQEVARLYAARGSVAHCGSSTAMEDVRASYMILREIMLRAATERRRPPRLEDMTSLY